MKHLGLSYDPNILEVILEHPDARWAADIKGWYIMDGLEVLGYARKLNKAWKNAAQNLTKKKKGPKATRP